MPKRVSILGLGLIGGSIGLGLTRTHRVTGYDDNAKAAGAARDLGAIHTAARSAAIAVADADLVILACPVEANPILLREIAGTLRPDALVTDTGSVKEAICRVGQELLGERFVGGHPMAGAIGSGIHAARADLFHGAAWALICADGAAASSASYGVVEGLVRHLGAVPARASAAEHDTAAALASHLPHLISWAYSGTVAGDAGRELAQRIAGGSYRDIMRVAASNPELWAGILTANGARLEAAAAEFRLRFDVLTAAIGAGDAPALARLLRASAPDQPPYF